MDVCTKKEHQRVYILHIKKYNEYKIIDNIVYIKLSNCDEYTMIDLIKWDENPYIKELCWWKNSKGYAYTKIPKRYREMFNNKKNIFLHQIIYPCDNNLI